MNNRLWIDQSGQMIWARTIKDLRRSCGGGRVSLQYSDAPDGRVYHTGYVIGTRWFTGFIPMRIEIKRPKHQPTRRP